MVDHSKILLVFICHIRYFFNPFCENRKSISNAQSLTFLQYCFRSEILSADFSGEVRREAVKMLRCMRGISYSLVINSTGDI